MNSRKLPRRMPASAPGAPSIGVWKCTVVADVKTARLVYTVRNGKIARYELENLDDAD